MRARLLIIAACFTCMFAAASWTPSARSQAPVTTATVTAVTTATSATTPLPGTVATPAPPAAPATAAQTDPAAGTTTGPATADTAQADATPATDTSDVDPDAPEIVVDFPDTAETAGDSKDDGVIEVVTTDTTPAPAPAPVAPAPVAAGPVFVAPAAATPQATPQPDPKPKTDPVQTNTAQTPSDQPVIATSPAATPANDGGTPPPASDKSADNTPAVLKKLKKYEPAAHASEITAITAGAVGTIGALAAGLGAAAGGGGSRRGSAAERGARGVTSTAGAGGGAGGGDDEGGGWLEGAEIERELGALPGLGWGDRSRTWGWRTTPQVDSFSTSWPQRLAKVSPVIGRVAVDGDYLRAIMGGLYLLLFPAAIVLGILAAGSTGGAALPPTFGLFVAILTLGIFDSLVGYTAGITFALVLLLGGHITDGNSIREVAGLILVWFAVPLAASAVRPLRRNLDLSVTGLWDRGTDFVLAGLFGGWVASNQVSALGPLRGYELPISDKRWTVAIVVIALVGIRILVETATTHLYPERLEAVEAAEDLEPPRIQETISLCVQMGVLAFISASFLGLSWALWVGVAVFFMPLIPWLFIEKLPYNAFVAKWMPAGLAKWSFIIVAGYLLSDLLGKLITDPTQSIEWSFILLPLPLLLCWALELFAENEPEEEDEEEEEGAATAEDEDEGRFPMTWPLRLAGVPVVAFSVYLVYFVIG